MHFQAPDMVALVCFLGALQAAEEWVNLVLAGETGAGAASPPLRRPSAADLLNILAGVPGGVGDLGGRFAPPFF